MSKNEKGVRVFKIVLTGGPCGGKTSGLAVLTEFFEQAGWKVYRIPETNAILMNVGIKFGELKGTDIQLFQTNIMRTTMRIEKTFFDLSNTSSVPCLVLCDGGVMDIAAHISHDTWEQLKMDNHWHEVYLRDRRYDQIIHLVTSAKGASTFYQAQHNPILKSIDQAISLDDRIADAWLGHPYYYIIDNSTNFEKKMLRTLAAVCLRVGVPFSDGNLNDVKKQKFLVDSVENMNGVKCEELLIGVTLLASNDPSVKSRIIRRGMNVEWLSNSETWNFDSGIWNYTLEVKKDNKLERSNNISLEEYQLFKLQQDPRYEEMFVKSKYFLWQNFYFRLNHLIDSDLIFLETHTSKVASEISIPPFVKIKKVVTDDETYSMYNLAASKRVLKEKN